jgi:hypothetical protein
VILALSITAFVTAIGAVVWLMVERRFTDRDTFFND